MREMKGRIKCHLWTELILPIVSYVYENLSPAPVLVFQVVTPCGLTARYCSRQTLHIVLKVHQTLQPRGPISPRSSPRETLLSVTRRILGRKRLNVWQKARENCTVRKQAHNWYAPICYLNDNMNGNCWAGHAAPMKKLRNSHKI
jgi:hypothetical protein